jgi:hypothetical protein
MDSFDESVSNMFSDESIINLSSKEQEILVNGFKTCDNSLPGETDDVIKLLETLGGLDAVVELLKFF